MNKRVFELVKSLSKNEKGYFKKYSQKYIQEDGNNCILLFDAIDKQEQYDEKEIKNKFATKKFVTQLHVTKIYLYELVLKSLEAYHNEHYSMRGKLYQIELLFDKGLYDHCEVIIER